MRQCYRIINRETESITMEAILLLVRNCCLLLITLEVLLVSTAQSLGIADGQFPRKHSASSFPLRPEIRKKPEKRSPKIDENVLEQIRSLEFMNTILVNSSIRNSKCDKNDYITLNHSTFHFNTSSKQRFEKQAKNAKLIAEYLTNLYKHDNKLSFQSDSDKHIPAIIIFLRTIVEADDSLVGGGIGFATNYFPYIYKNDEGITNKSFDMSKMYNFTEAAMYRYFVKRPVLVYVYDPDSDVTSDVIKDTFIGRPSYDCKHLKRWIVSLSYPFYGYSKSGTDYVFKGVVILEIDLKKTSISQCPNSGTLFSGSNLCRPESTECQFTNSGQGLKPGNYECHCKPGFYFPELNATQKFYSGTQIERQFLDHVTNDGNLSTSDFQCLPCRPGCVNCTDDNPCFVEYNILMRGIPLGIQSFCMTITLVLGIVVLRFRKCMVMVIGMWCFLETMLLGALFLYATVVIQYFEPSTTTCLIVPWLREVGFAILYGALVLKIYRLLAEFQSRKAHRVHVRDKDLLKYLLGIVIVVTGYMAAWTSVNIDQVEEGKSMVDTGVTSEGDLRYLVCRSGWWDYSTEVAEVVFLCFGIYLCYRVRSAPSDYSEGTYISAAICYECFISTVFYVLRHIYWLHLHPDYLFLMYFLRCQLTVTVTLVLVFGPKLWYAHRPPDERSIRNRAYSSSEAPDNMTPETMKLNVGISSNGDVDVGEVSLADMDPEDIRAELKRLYTQLQIYKTRSMRKDNPHISKRRGGRKQTHRRFSLQAFHHKHRHHHDHEHEHEMSKTPEESTNSAEGLPLPMEMSVSKCDELNENKASSTVSFKMCHTHK